VAYQDEPYMEYLQGIGPQLEQEYGALRPTPYARELPDVLEAAQAAGYRGMGTYTTAWDVLTNPDAYGHEEQLKQWRMLPWEEQKEFVEKATGHTLNVQPKVRPAQPVGTFGEYLGSQEERLRGQYYQTPSGFQELQKRQTAQATATRQAETAATQTEQTRLQGIETAEYERRQKLRKPRTIYQPLGVR